MSAKKLLVIAVAAYLIFLIARFPASAAVAWFTPDSVQVSQARGTIWSGNATAVLGQGLVLGTTTWSFAPSALFKARLGANISAQLQDGAIEARVSRGIGQRLYINNLTGIVPLQQIPGVMNPELYSASVGLDLARLVLDNGWPVDATGTIDVVNLSVVQPTQRKLGSYALNFDGKSSNPLIASVKDVDGLLQVDGSVSLNEDRGYIVDCQITPRPGTPRELVQILDLLGERGPEGQRRLVLEGTAP